MSSFESVSRPRPKLTTASHESAVCGSFFELNGSCPPNLQRLLDFAPESFTDPRAGKVAETIRQLRAEGVPISSVSVAEAVRFENSATYVMWVASEALPLAAAEFEAESLWSDFVNRQTAKVFAKAGESLLASPRERDSILQGVRAELQRLDTCSTSLAEKAEARLYRPDLEIPRPDLTYSINGVPIATPGNIETISGPAKSGKTSLKSGLVASTFAAPGADCLGCGSSNPNGYAVIDIDSEQSLYDHQEQNKLTSRRAGRPLPTWVKSYCLTGFSAEEIRQLVPLLMENNRREFGGIHSVILDGGADALHDVNDPGESNGMIAEHHRLAIKYSCPIFTVIHENPGESNRKMRGHYGSQAERKAETNLRVEKDQDGICTVWADKTRHRPIPKNTGPRFAWDTEKQMHVSVESQQDAKKEAEFAELSALFKNAFNTRPAVTFSDLKAGVKQAVTVSDKTAERRIARAVTLQIIKKTFAGLYELRT